MVAPTRGARGVGAQLHRGGPRHLTADDRKVQFHFALLAPFDLAPTRGARRRICRCRAPRLVYLKKGA